MHTWVRRGLQTALVTGGLLMLGTGIASADENVNPDQPPNPVDAGLTVPIDTSHNAVGTPFGQYETPSVHRTISTGDVTGAVPMAGKVSGVTQALPTQALPTKAIPTQALTQANPLLQQARPQLGGVGGGDLFRGNKVDADVVVPVELCGNAIAAGGDAHEDAMCSQSVSRPDPISTNGDHRALAGNVVAANPTIPVQGTGNAIAVVGDAYAKTVAGQSGTTGGDIRTAGDGGVVSGTIGAVQWATPVQVADNAVAGAGDAGANSASEDDGVSTGSLKTGGNNGTAAGTVAGVPVAVPFQVDGNGVSGIGNAASKSTTTSNSTAGSTNANNIGLWGHPTWILTDGDPSTASGNVAQPQVSGPVSVDDNAAGAVANTSANSTNNSTNAAGGLTSTTGTGSTGSGNVADAPVALPSSGAGNAATGIGNAATSHTNNTSSTAGGDTLTNGNNSTLSGNSANVPPAGAVDVCGDSAGGVGGAAGSCNNNVTSHAGGYNGTTGNGSTGSGNVGQIPVSAPVESYGTTAGGAANTTSTANETKRVTSGGTPNSADDNGTLTSNVVTTPTAVPAQVFGDGASVVGNSGVTTDSDTVTTAGGPPKATGKNATGAGNIVYVPSSVPTQVFGATDSVVGNGSTLTTNKTLSTAGGDAHANGAGGSVSGNVAQVSNQPVDQVFGEAGNVVGIGGSNTGNTLNSQAGGSTTTDGDYGSLAGNAIALPDSVTNPVSGDAVSAAGKTYANGTSDVNEASGGQLNSSGRHANGSGNVITLPVESDPDVFGDAVGAAGGNATGVDDNNQLLNNGGDSFTNGGGFLDAYNLNEPLGADADVTNAPVPVLGQAETMVVDNSVVNNGYQTEQPSAMALPGGFGGKLGYGAITPQFPQLPTNTVLNNVPSVPSLGGVPSVPSTQAAPAGLPGLPALPTLPGGPQVPALPLAQGAVAQASNLPVGNALRVPMSAVATAQSLAGNTTGLTGVSGISGVLPVAPAFLPKI
jgi:hypothetical protein